MPMMGSLTRPTLPLIIALALGLPSVGRAADFYLHFNSCRITVGYLVLSEESLKTFEGDGSLTSCTRVSQRIRCDFQFAGASRGYRNSDEYMVHVETPPMLIFTNTNMTDYYVIDQSQHAVTLITRVLDAKFAGAKVCHGIYMTESERRELQKQPKK
jgi:hypothetical protein